MDSLVATASGAAVFDPDDKTDNNKGGDGD